MQVQFKILWVVSCCILAIAGCKPKSSESEKDSIRKMQGLYVFGPEFKTFTNCKDGREFWVVDSVKTLELSYSNLNFEKPYEPVYVELEGFVRESDSEAPNDYDSTIVVTKVVTITKKIPDGPCSR